MKERERKRIRSGNLKSKRNGIYARYETRFLPGFRSYRNLITRSLRLVKLRHSRGRCEISILPSCGLLEKETSSSRKRDPPREREILLEREREMLVEIRSPIFSPPINFEIFEIRRNEWGWGEIWARRCNPIS